MITSASAAGGGDDPQAGGLGLRAALGGLGQADAHVDAGVVQVQRVGVALAAVADDGDLPALDQRQVGVVVIGDRGHRWCLSVRPAPAVRRRG
jgi:hypothetical protein